MQIDHVSIPVADLAAARAFYEQALAPLGVQVVAEVAQWNRARGRSGARDGRATSGH